MPTTTDLTYDATGEESGPLDTTEQLAALIETAARRASLVTATAYRCIDDRYDPDAETL